ncbi:hypothetical protein B0H10DRAFT_2084607, partial [Mycena sp. CBHHK59/15]
MADTDGRERVEQLCNVLFRVYRGILAARSPVFRDMLALPQPDDAKMLDGCPVVHLSDSAADTMYFLKALFDYEFFESYPAKTDFDAIFGILRLGQKYQVEPLRKRPLVHLSSAHPTTLAGWDALAPTWDFECLELPALTLARDARAYWALPAAFYLVVGGFGGAELLDGVDCTGVHVELSHADKVTCLTAAPVLLGDALSEMLGFLWLPTVIPGCCNVEACLEDRLETRQVAEKWRRDGLLPLTIWTEDDWERLDVCDVCVAAMKASHQECRERFWEGLPRIFGLPDWEELEKMKKAALES